MKKYSDKQRYDMYKKIVETNKTKRLGTNEIMSVYLGVINKAQFAWEIDEALDAILYNEELLKTTGRGKL